MSHVQNKKDSHGKNKKFHMKGISSYEALGATFLWRDANIMDFGGIL